MKRSTILLLLSIILSSSAAFAQYTFPLPELVKLPSKNASDFETIMLEKDYSLQTKLSDQVSKVYTSDKAGVNDKKYTFVRRQVPNAAVGITFTTTDKKYYLDIKAKLAASGYKFVKEEHKTIEKVEATWYHYSNGTMNVSICSYTTDANWFAVQVHL
ncbi:hypothetical protein GCM10023093_06450 [Nemorincola caseinilytica]|uniref:Uncharacterized protein n=1 Tax=Nemorincola caseinilytica TaxID=2054315 RepID=A0ABP8N5D6_9BACT